MKSCILLSTQQYAVRPEPGFNGSIGGLSLGGCGGFSAATTEARRERVNNKDAATAERMAAIEEQRRQLAARLGDELAEKARQAQAALQRHQEDEQHRAAFFQACTASWHGPHTCSLDHEVVVHVYLAHMCVWLAWALGAQQVHAGLA